jgi:hypothetical protein
VPGTLPNRWLLLLLLLIVILSLLLSMPGVMPR